MENQSKVATGRLTCPDPDCKNHDSTDNNNFRGVQKINQKWNPQTGRVDWENEGDEQFFCWECGKPAASEGGDTVLESPPGRPIKRGDGDATNLPDMFDTSEQKEE